MPLERKIRKCWGNNEEPAYRLHRLEVCSATNADQPNFNANARGRKCHLAKNDTHTVCNMLIDRFCPESDQRFTFLENKCKVCFNPVNVKLAMSK